MLPLPLSCDAFAQNAHTHRHTNTRVKREHSEARRRVSTPATARTNVKPKPKTQNTKSHLQSEHPLCSCNSKKLTKVLHLQHLNEIKHISCSCNGRRRRRRRESERQPDIGRELICWMCQGSVGRGGGKWESRALREFVRWKFCAWSLS